MLQALIKAPFKPLRTNHLSFLTYKVVFLVTITSTRRISEEDCCIFHSDRVVLRLDPAFIPKINSYFIELRS